MNTSIILRSLNRSLSGIKLIPNLKLPLLLSLLLPLTFLLTSCGSSVNRFYERHKNDAGATAVEAPNFVVDLFSSGSGIMKDVVPQVDAIRFLSLPKINESKSQALAGKLNRITSSGYTEVYLRTRPNGSIKKFVVKERGDRIKELVWFDQRPNGKNVLFLFQGDFDTDLVGQLSKHKSLDNLKELVKEQL